ncbi:MAG TPA: 3-phosphoshikimate 1-carboxyvinyltransferase [Thermoanaerobaculia bacterium]|nr:3-phosphoshikimate 1-carboxyvinyltransferase [Thermoanaerobaculia bacterium]
MTEFLALPLVRRVAGTVRVPPSKSASNRALLLAALSSEPVEIIRPLESADTAALLGCLRAMGAQVAPAARGLRLFGPLGVNRSSETILDAGDSGTAARFVAALAAATPGSFRLDGSRRLRERPMAELIEALRSGGAEIRCLQVEGQLPLAIRGGMLRSGEIAIDASRSSQFLSALLLAAPAVEGGLTVRTRGAVASAPYVETTVEALVAFGHRVRRVTGAFTVERGAVVPGGYEVPGDHSSAVPLLSAAGAVGGTVTVLGIRADSSAADARALPVLERMGIALDCGAEGITASGSRGGLEAIEVEAGEFPDSVPALAALAALAEGESRFRSIGNLRWKESDRIEALEALIRAAGGSSRAGSAELVVRGGIRRGLATVLPTLNDHRLAMAAALLSIARGGYLIENPGCVAKSYPSFFRDLSSLFS